MKKLLFALLILPAASFAQKTGKWKIAGVIIERKDSIQIEYTPIGIDTLSVKWLSEASYSLTSRLNPPVVVTITKTDKRGYSGVVTDGNKVKRFRANVL